MLLVVGGDNRGGLGTAINAPTNASAATQISPKSPSSSFLARRLVRFLNICGVEDMKTQILALLILFFSSPAFSGPFGTSEGMTKSDLGITSSTKEISLYKYQLTDLPKTSSLFEAYVVQVTPKNGLCYLKAVGVTVSSSRYGEGVRNMFDRVNAALSKKYTSGNLQDFLRTGSIWDEPEDFMMGLNKKERILAGYYDEEEGSVMVENIEKAYLRALALSNDKGYVVVDYYFENHDSCQAEVDAAENDVF
jgi:hypothetical protein